MWLGNRLTQALAEVFRTSVIPLRAKAFRISAMLAAIEGSCVTHENPPLIYWKPENAQTTVGFPHAPLQFAGRILSFGLRCLALVAQGESPTAK
jgi:hypothetical protein